MIISVKPVEKEFAKITVYKYADTHYITYDPLIKPVFYGFETKLDYFRLLHPL
ncbi:MAG: hypothetical protein H8D45_11435 [Bacteroidetes bacterium]|nr:hypothetical protein [Bacteroidota bacterium]MBL7104362.1 hypothetical protein [Bacteroidales bacterium]